MGLVGFLIYPVATSPVSECIIELEILDSMHTETLHWLHDLWSEGMGKSKLNSLEWTLLPGK